MSHVGRRACRMSEQGRGRCGRRSGFSERRAEGGELLRCVLPDAVLPGEKTEGAPVILWGKGRGKTAARKARSLPALPGQHHSGGRERGRMPGFEEKEGDAGHSCRADEASVVREAEQVVTGRERSFFRKGPCCRRGRDTGGNRLYHGVLLLLRAPCREKEGPWPRCWCSVWEMC